MSVQWLHLSIYLPTWTIKQQIWRENNKGIYKYAFHIYGMQQTFACSKENWMNKFSLLSLYQPMNENVSLFVFFLFNAGLKSAKLFGRGLNQLKMLTFTENKLDTDILSILTALVFKMICLCFGCSVLSNTKVTYNILSQPTKRTCFHSLNVLQQTWWSHVPSLSLFIVSRLHASIIHFASPSAECPVVFNRVLIGPFAHVVDACIPYCKTLKGNRQFNYMGKY